MYRRQVGADYPQSGKVSCFAQSRSLGNRMLFLSDKVNSMSAFERLLVPGCTELPVCRCGKEMQIASLDQHPARSDVHIRVYNCRACHHEMRLTVWATDTVAERPPRLAAAPHL